MILFLAQASNSFTSFISSAVFFTLWYAASAFFSVMFSVVEGHGLLWKTCSCHFSHIVCIFEHPSCITRWRADQTGLYRMSTKTEYTCDRSTQRAACFPVRGMLFLKGLSHSHEDKENNAGPKEHYIRSNMLCSKSLHQDSL